MNPHIKTMLQSIILIARIARENRPKKDTLLNHVFQKGFIDFAESPFYKEGQEAKTPVVGDLVSDHPLSNGYTVSFFVGGVKPTESHIEVEMTKMLFKKGGTLIPEINPNAQFKIFTDSGWRCPEFSE